MPKMPTSLLSLATGIRPTCQRRWRTSMSAADVGALAVDRGRTRRSSAVVRRRTSSPSRTASSISPLAARSSSRSRLARALPPHNASGSYRLPHRRDHPLPQQAGSHLMGSQAFETSQNSVCVNAGGLQALAGLDQEGSGGESSNAAERRAQPERRT
jgi:hypothetical protein